MCLFWLLLAAQFPFPLEFYSINCWLRLFYWQLSIITQTGFYIETTSLLNTQINVFQQTYLTPVMQHTCSHTQIHTHTHSHTHITHITHSSVSHNSLTIAHTELTHRSLTLIALHSVTRGLNHQQSWVYGSSHDKGECVCVCEWVCVWVSVWVSEWVSVCVRVSVCASEWVYECASEWVCEWVSEYVWEWVCECVCVCICVCEHVCCITGVRYVCWKTLICVFSNDVVSM